MHVKSGPSRKPDGAQKCGSPNSEVGQRRIRSPNALVGKIGREAAQKRQEGEMSHDLQTGL